MKNLLYVFIIAPIITFGQQILNLEPTLGWTVEKSLKGEKDHLNHIALCEDFWENRGGFLSREDLSEEERAMFDSCAADLPEYWSINGIGCSWYCGGGLDTQSASSELSSSAYVDYKPSNAHDLSYKTAWVEGVPGYGIGECLRYHIEPTNPRITEIIVVNGYVKSDNAWRDNSRVKTLKMYIDDAPYAILNLEDTKAEQHFEVAPIGKSNRADLEALKKLPKWVIKFEILDVYKGDKYEDTAITEIYFDGIDVH